MKLAYSTLACPRWTWRQAIDTARRLGYDGVEWRLVDGVFVDADFPLGRAEEIGEATTDAGLAVPALDSSISLAVAPGPEREATFAATARLLYLARAFGAQFLRVFPGTYPESVADEDAVTWVRELLLRLRPEARETGVTIALELHGPDGWDRAATRGVTCSRLVADILRNLGMPEAGVQWDVGNAVLEGESPAQTWRNVRDHLCYVQLKDMARQPDGSWRYVPVGTGELPLPEILEWLGGREFDGWVSFEWEKWWHPELPEPETVLPGFVSYLAGYRGARP